MHAYRARDGSLAELCIVSNRVYGRSCLRCESDLEIDTCPRATGGAVCPRCRRPRPVVIRPWRCRFPIVPVISLLTFHVRVMRRTDCLRYAKVKGQRMP